jgi:hypothetical protein
MRECLLVFFTAILLANSAFSQEEKERKWTLNGYIKNLTTYSVQNTPLPQAQDKLLDNLVHNRLNFKWYPFENLKFVAEMRNRIFMGDQVRLNPYYADLAFRGADDYWTLSKYWEDSSRVIFHTILDRLYFQYTKDKFETKLGRQRINWGINTAFNPNDIFNAFSYFNFDYEERPGSDAILVKYYTGIASSVEIAAKMADSLNVFTGAALWKINYHNYDIQFLGGLTNGNLVVGSGWAGNIKQAGFKGEGSYFYPLRQEPFRYEIDSNDAVVGTISLDYSFKNSLYLLGSIMYSSNGSKSPNALEQLAYYSGAISAKFLSPYTWTGFVQASYQFHPLVNGALAIIGYPGSSDAFLNPYLTISAKQNFDIDLISQLLFNQVKGDFKLTNQLYFLRLKYSF